MQLPTPGRRTLLAWFLAATYALGTAVHVYFTVLAPEAYESFANLALFDAYRDLWTDLAVPNLWFLLPAVIVFEAALAVGLFVGGRAGRLANLLGAAFQVGIAPMGPWAPVNLALAAAHGYLFRRGVRDPAIPEVHERPQVGN